MNKKSMITIVLILLLAAVLILGLPFLVRSIENRAENTAPVITATPVPVFEDIIEDIET